MRHFIIITGTLLYLKLVGTQGMFWYNRTFVEIDLVQHQISFAGSSDVGSVSLRPTSLFPARQIWCWTWSHPTSVYCFDGIGNFSAHARFQTWCVLLWIWVAKLWLGYLYDHTFTTNLVSRSAVTVNVLFVLDCGRVFWLTVAAYVFWLLTTCCLNACFFVFRTPFVWCNMWPSLQLAHFGFLALHPLWEWFSPQIRHLTYSF